MACSGIGGGNEWQSPDRLEHLAIVVVADLFSLYQQHQKDQLNAEVARTRVKLWV